MLLMSAANTLGLPGPVIRRSRGGAFRIAAVASLSILRGSLLALALFACAPASVAGANEFGGNTSWAAPAAADVANQEAISNMLQDRAGGYYKQWNNSQTYNSYNTTATNIAGNQVNCTLSSSAVGNSGSTSGYASTSSPTVTSTPTTGAYSTGNSTAGSASGGSGTTASPLNSNQANYGSPVASSVTGTVSSAGVGSLSAGGSTSTQVLNSTQSNASSPQVSSISNSSACSGVATQSASWK